MSDVKVKAEGGDGGKDREVGETKKKGFNFKAPPQRAKFEGKCEGLKGAIYDCSDTKQADIFIKTTKDLSNYCGQTMKFGGNMRIAVVTLKKPVFPLPKLPEGADEGDRELKKDDIKSVGKRRTFLEENIKTLYAIIWGQCTDIMQQKIEAADNFDKVWAEGDGLALLEIIKSITYAFQSQKYTGQSLFEAYKKFFNQ